MIFGLDRKSKTFRLFSPSALGVEGVLFVSLCCSLFNDFRTFLESSPFIKMQGRVYFIN